MKFGKHETNGMMRVLHVNEVARAGSSLVEEARSRGMDWRLLDTVRLKHKGKGLLAIAERAVRGSTWAVALWNQARKSDIVHVHAGYVVKHTRWARKDYVLHLHGSDVRVFQYDPRYRDHIHRAIAEAQMVYYATPDLWEHIRDLRPDAQLFPVVASTARVPQAQPGNSPRVVFPSRWDDSKGGQAQLDIAAAVMMRTGNTPVEGLAWGANWRAAEALGIVMRPRMAHDEYLAWLASATVAVGQSTGCLGASELEAMATGIPLVAPLNPRWYDGKHPSTIDVPVFGGMIDDVDGLPAQVGDAVEALLETPILTDAAAWVEALHGPRQAVDRLIGAYAQILKAC